MAHPVNLSEWLLVSQIVGYSAGTVIVVLLFALVRRAARVDDTRTYSLLLWSGLLWNAGHLALTIALSTGHAKEARPVRLIVALAFTGAALSPAGALTVWRRSDRNARVAGTALVRVALAAGILLSLLMWVEQGWPGALVSDVGLLWMFGAYHVAAFFAIGALLFYKSHVTLAAARVAIGMMALGALGVGLSVLLQKGPLSGLMPDARDAGAFEVLRQVATHLMTLGALFLFARFRLADVFIRQTLRLVAASLLGLLCIAIVASPGVLRASPTAPAARVVAIAGAALLIAGLLLSFVLLDRLIVAIVDRWLFRQPDYGAALRRLRDDLASRHDDLPLHEATVRLVCETLPVRAARIVPSDTLPAPLRDALAQRDILDTADTAAGLMAPVRTRGLVTNALTVTATPDHPTFLARELEFLRAAATALGHRLDLVHREREEIERRTHEAHLRQQLSDATLRALQAQVNPHFLFNTLNTIAHLVQEDPARAEEMILRLAEVFSHVLTRSDRPFSSVSEEMDFLRTYLTIEEARFGDRLRVAFAVEPAAAQAAIPSLILQPAVENALKHGFARKIGAGHLTISAGVEGASLRLSVEDDGVGPSANGSSRRPGSRSRGDASARTSGGRGLRNIAERLQTLYADAASLRFEAAPHGGSVVTLRIPLHGPLHGHDQKPVD